MSERMLILGCGYAGREIAREAMNRGWHVAGTARTRAKTDALAAAGIEAHRFEGETVGAALAATMRQATHLVMSIAPGVAGDPLLTALGDRLRPAMPQLTWAGYLSTVGVYGDRGGGWVDETTPCHPMSDRSARRLRVEEAWLEAGARDDYAVAILRLSGIYGPGRNPLVRLAEGTARCIVKPGQVFNRIHVADIASATLMLAEAKRGGIYNVSDDEPAPPQDPIVYAAELMGIDPPPPIPFEQAEMTPMGRSFYEENKRVSNRKLKAAGYRFRFADHRAGLGAMWSQGDWRG